MPDAIPPRRSRRKLGIFGIGALIGVAVLVFTGIESRDRSAAELQQWTETQAMPTVAIALLNPKPVVASLDLPGRLEAYVRAPIYARVSGYVKNWAVDIGGAAKTGQARADLANSQASARLADVTLNRGRALLTSNAVSQQDVDQRAADLASKQATVHSNEANVERLQVLAGYKKIAAPFDGLVTERNTDVGALISAGSSAGLAMFVISDVRKLRVSINVPQNYAPAIKIGAQASLSVPEYPGRAFPAVVVASARSVDVGSGTTHMQLIVDNANGELMPGAYANVHADLAGAAGTLRIPVSALIFDQKGLRVATVKPDDSVLFKTVTIAADLGSEIEIGSGITADDRVIAAPPDGIADGDKVRIAGDRSKQGAPMAERTTPEKGGGLAG